MPNVTGVISP